MSLVGHLLTPPKGEIMPLAFEELTVLESGAGDAVFVVEAKGGSNANEIGVGALLSEANRTLTCFGTAAAASGDWRNVSANGGFTVTGAWVDAFLRNSTGFAMLWHLRNTNAAGTGGYLNLFYLLGSSPADWSIFVRGLSSDVGMYGYMAAKFGVTGGSPTASPAEILPASGEFHVLLSVDYVDNLAFMGVSLGTVQPAALSDFVLYAVSEANQTVPASAVTGTSLSIIGKASAGASMGFKSLTAKLGPSVSLVV